MSAVFIIGMVLSILAGALAAHDVIPTPWSAEREAQREAATSETADAEEH